MTEEAKQPGFEVLLGQLEQVVATLERGDVPLEQALADFERGMALVKQATGILDQAQETVTQLVEGRGGVLQETPFVGEPSPG